MDITTDLFLDCLFLLMNENTSRHRTYVKDLIALYEDESRVIDTSDTELMKFYIRILQSVMDNGIDRKDPDALALLLLKFKSDRALINHRSVIDDLQTAFRSKESISHERLEKIVKTIANVVLWHRTNKLMKQNYARLNKAAEIRDPELQTLEMNKIRDGADSVSNLFAEVHHNQADKVFDVIDFKDRKTVEVAMKKQVARNVLGVMKTGLIGLNRALGKAGGIVSGESVCFAALPHHYKSGLLVSTAVWAVVNNIQMPDEKGRMPLVFMVTLENEAFQNMIWIFKQRYAMETGRSADHLSSDQALDWICDYFERYGTRLIIERHLPDKFSFKTFVDRYTYWESQGYNIILTSIDYPNLMNKSTGDQTVGLGRDTAVKILFSNLCNFTKHKGTAFISAHPINRDGQKAIGNSTMAVKKFTLEHLGDSIDVEREVDVMIYVHLETNHLGQKYLTCCLRKHRYVDDTPESHKLFAYPFTPLGIMDDIGGAPSFVTDIYAVGYDDQPVSAPVGAMF